MTPFSIYHLFKIFFIISSLNNTFIQGVGTVLKKPDNDDTNLYSNFNKRLSLISNYAKNRIEEASAPYLDKLYKTNNEIITELDNKKKERQKPKKIHNYYDYNQFDNFNDELDEDDTSELQEDDTKTISKNLNRLMAFLGKSKPKPVNENNEQEQIIRINSNNDDQGNNEEDAEASIPIKEIPSLNLKIGKPIVETTLIKTDKANPTDADIATWVKGNPEKFQTFVHAMYILKNKDNKKIKNEITCLIYCDQLKANGSSGNGQLNKRCICRNRKKRQQISNIKPDANRIVQNTKDESPLLLASLSSTKSKQETPFQSSRNFLNNNNEDSNHKDEEKLNGNLIGSPALKPYMDEKIAFAEPSIKRFPKCDSCSQMMDVQSNATVVLDRVLQELDMLKEDREKLDQNCSDGKPCNLTGSWNSEIIGMQFNLNSSCGGEHELTVTVEDHYPPKRTSMMDTNWTLVGYALHINGGPFYMAATRSKEEILATFTGVCRICTGADTIFGAWNFIRPAKDCRDLLMAVEVKRDVFHRSSLHAKVLEKKKLLHDQQQAADTYNMDILNLISVLIPPAVRETSNKKFIDDSQRSFLMKVENLTQMNVKIDKLQTTCVQEKTKMQPLLKQLEKNRMYFHLSYQLMSINIFAVRF